MNDRPTAPEPAHGEGAADNPVATSERPYWLTEPCPAWCVLNHHVGEMREDRVHIGADHQVPLMLEPAARLTEDHTGPYECEYASIHLSHHVEHRDPTIRLGRGEETGMTLRPEEAEAIAQQLVALVQEARR